MHRGVLKKKKVPSGHAVADFACKLSSMLDIFVGFVRCSVKRPRSIDGRLSSGTRRLPGPSSVRTNMADSDNRMDKEFVDAGSLSRPGMVVRVKEVRSQTRRFCGNGRTRDLIHSDPATGLRPYLSHSFPASVAVLLRGQHSQVR